MKSVLISIRPQWCKKIASGEKTIEVRKTAPKETPFKAYIYCTKDKYDWLYRVDNNGRGKAQSWHGKVIGEFICDKIYELFPFAMGTGIELLDEVVLPEQFCKDSCLTEQEICDYIGEKDGYGQHISDLKIYDKPKELSEFGNLCRKDCLRLGKGGKSCKFLSTDGTPCNRIIPITRPPQSWQYIEEL